MLYKDTLRSLRRNQIIAEEAFWKLIRGKQIKNHKFNRQFAVIFDYEGKKRFFIADFYCHTLKLIIEIDGKIHDKQKEYDDLSYKILKFKNENIIKEPKSVITKLYDYL